MLMVVGNERKKEDGERRKETQVVGGARRGMIRIFG